MADFKFSDKTGFQPATLLLEFTSIISCLMISWDNLVLVKISAAKLDFSETMPNKRCSVPMWSCLDSSLESCAAISAFSLGKRAVLRCKRNYCRSKALFLIFLSSRGEGACIGRVRVSSLMML